MKYRNEVRTHLSLEKDARSRTPLRGQGVFFAAQFSAGYITNMPAFDLRQAQPCFCSATSTVTDVSEHPATADRGRSTNHAVCWRKSEKPASRRACRVFRLNRARRPTGGWCRNLREV